MEIFHLLGLCPDSLSHIDLIDIFILNYNQIILILMQLKDVFVYKIKFLMFTS
jgi:hypothetical protein